MIIHSVDSAGKRAAAFDQLASKKPVLASPLPTPLPRRLADLAQDTDLAQVLNYAMFDIGGAAAQVRPYTAQEVGQLRKASLGTTSVLQVRKVLVDDLIRECSAPTSLREYPSRNGEVGGSRASAAGL